MPRRTQLAAPIEDPPFRRGLVLLALHAQYPKGLVRKALVKMVGYAYEGDLGEFDKDMGYLEEQGYIRVEDFEVPDELLSYDARRQGAMSPAERTYQIYKLLPAGMNLVDRVVSDPGVMLPPGR